MITKEMIMKAMTIGFENINLTTIIYKDRPAWIAKEVGERLGYGSDGRELSKMILDEWSNEFVDAVDYTLIRGQELKDLKAVLPSAGYYPPGEIAKLLLIFDTGLYLVLFKTRKPIGVRLRRFLATEVLPQIAKTGMYIPDRGAPVQNPLEMELQKLKIEVLRETIDEMKADLSKEAVSTLRIALAETATGKDLQALLPAVEDRWLTPTQIGDRLGVSANKVGRIITKLGIRGNHPGIARSALNKAKTSDRNVNTYQYSPDAVKMIREELTGKSSLYKR